MENVSLTTIFTRYNCPEWIFPACGNRTLKIKQDTFRTADIRLSREAACSDDWDPEWDREVYSCIFECESSKCREVVASSGIGWVEVNPLYPLDEEERYVQYYQAKSFVPALSAFTLPKSCPESVRQALELSFNLILISPGSAANAVRISLEELMTSLGIQKQRPNESLQSRINRLPSEYKVHQEALIAIKWLGNVGSHTLDEVRVNDVEEAYNIIDFVLGKLYEGKTETIRELSKRMTLNFSSRKTT